MNKLLKFAVLFTLVATLFASVTCVACAENDGPTITAKEAILVSEDGQILFEKNSREHRPIASMTKIMTLLCVYDAVDEGKISLDDNVCVSERAAGMGGSQVFLQANGVYKVADLVKSVIVCSANDSCVALAEHISGSVEGFVKNMNDKATALGLADTHFDNCTGLPAVSQFSCAADVAVMMGKLVTHPHYFECAHIWTEDFEHPGGRVTGMTNTNKLVRFYQGCDGGKTGYTGEAKHCLSATACRNGMRVIAVVVGADDSKTRFKEVSDMFNYAFANYENKIYLDVGADVGKISVVGGKCNDADIVADGKLVCFGKKGQTSAEVRVEMPDNIVAPLAKGDVVGRAVLVRDGQQIGGVNLVCSADIAAKTYFDYLHDIITAGK